MEHGGNVRKKQKAHEVEAQRCKRQKKSEKCEKNAKGSALRLEPMTSSNNARSCHWGGCFICSYN